MFKTIPLRDIYIEDPFFSARIDIAPTVAAEAAVPHYPLPVVQERYAPGGAGNAACNIAALKPGVLKVIGLFKIDPILEKRMEELLA